MALLRRWLYTPIIIWQGDWTPRDATPKHDLLMPWLIIHQGQFAQNASSWKFWDSIPWSLVSLTLWLHGWWIKQPATEQRQRKKQDSQTLFTSIWLTKLTNMCLNMINDQTFLILVLVIQQNWFHDIRRFPFHTWKHRGLFCWVDAAVNSLAPNNQTITTFIHYGQKFGTWRREYWWWGMIRIWTNMWWPKVTFAFSSSCALESLIPSDKSIFKCKL